MTSTAPAAVDDATRDALVDAVRTFTRNEIIPNANRLDHADEYPEAIVEQMK